MSKITVTSRYEPKGLTADITTFDNADGCGENPAMEFARAMANHGYYVVVSSELCVIDGRGDEYV